MARDKLRALYWIMSKDGVVIGKFIKLQRDGRCLIVDWDEARRIAFGE
jgi:hypothetical protein